MKEASTGIGDLVSDLGHRPLIAPVARTEVESSALHLTVSLLYISLVYLAVQTHDIALACLTVWHPCGHRTLPCICMHVHGSGHRT